MTSKGFYKVNDSLKYICNQNNNGFTCPSENLCLSVNVMKNNGLKIDMRDLYSDSLNFDSIPQVIVYLFKMLTYDGWSDSYIILMSSDINKLILILIFMPPIILSILMHGLIISNFFSQINKIKNKEVGN